MIWKLPKSLDMETMLSGCPQVQTGRTGCQLLEYYVSFRSSLELQRLACQSYPYRSDSRL